MSNTKIGEWLWRFLAVVMMFSVAWTVWIIYQLNPPPLVMNAAFEAAAQAKGKAGPSEGQIAHGVIVPPAGADAASRSAEVPIAAAQLPGTPKEPPINPEKLKFSDTIVLPVADPNAKK